MNSNEYRIDSGHSITVWVNGQPVHYDADTAAGRDALRDAGAFMCVTDDHRFSVRLESKQRGPTRSYWTAYKRIDGKLRKTYVCGWWNLTEAALSEAEFRLFGPSYEPPAVG